MIQVARPADAETVARIYVESWNDGFADLAPAKQLDAERVARWQQALSSPPPARWWTAVRGGSIVGFAGIGPSRDPSDSTLGELDTIAVDPAHWRLGVGMALMSHALHHFAADGYREAVLWTFANYPRGAAFYRSTGWRPNGAYRDDGRQLSFTHTLL